MTAVRVWLCEPHGNISFPFPHSHHTILICFTQTKINVYRVYARQWLVPLSFNLVLFSLWLVSIQLFTFTISSGLVGLLLRFSISNLFAVGMASPLASFLICAPLLVDAHVYTLRRSGIVTGQLSLLAPMQTLEEDVSQWTYNGRHALQAWKLIKAKLTRSWHHMRSSTSSLLRSRKCLQMVIAFQGCLYDLLS